jgi:outer membrane protein TolC
MNTAIQMLLLAAWSMVVALPVAEAEETQPSMPSGGTATPSTSGRDANTLAGAAGHTPLPETPLISDEKFTPGEPITLAEALDAAAKRNLDLAEATLEIDKARAGLKKSWGLVLPVIQGKFDYTHMDHEDTVNLASSIAPLLTAMGITLPPGTSLGDPLLLNPQEKFLGALQVQVPLVNAEGWLTVQAAKKGVTVAQLSIETVRRQILLGTAQAYYFALSSKDLIDLYLTQIETAKEQRRVAEARFNAGRGMRIDVIRAETDIEKASQSLIAAELAFDNSRDVLAGLIGAKGLPMPLETPSLKIPSGSDADLEKRAMSSRADLKVDAAKIDLAKKQLDTVWMKFLPSLNLSFQGSYQFTDLPDMGSSDHSRWALMLGLAIPIYNHFRYGDLDEKRAIIKQAEIGLTNGEDKAGREVRKARRDYAAALSSVVTAEKQVALAEEALKLTEAAYLAGSGDSLAVTDARQTYIAAGFNHTTLKLKSQLALLTLLDAVGAEIPKNISTAAP